MFTNSAPLFSHLLRIYGKGSRGTVPSINGVVRIFIRGQINIKVIYEIINVISKLYVFYTEKLKIYVL